MQLNSCVFEKLVRLSLWYIIRHANLAQGLKKTIPGAPENEVPIHLRPKQSFAQYPGPQY